MIKPIAICLLCVPLALASISPACSQPNFQGERMPYDAFDALPSTTIAVDGGSLRVGFAADDLDLPKAEFLAWLTKSARAVSLYLGRFPVPSARVLIVPVDGAGVRGGQTFGHRGAAIRLLVGRNSTNADLARDWVAVHEMVHLALPDVRASHLWLAEGVAVYVESIARVQAGDLTAEKIWFEFVRDMPKGLPQPGDQGLDNTATWGRTYWGGAMFCLLADVEMGKRTGGRAGLQQALRGILAAGGNHEQTWPIQRILSVADGAVHDSVLSELYDKMRASPSAPDLDALWRELGIVKGDKTVTFDDTAALAGVRQSITRAP